MLFLKILKSLIFTCQFLINMSVFDDDFFLKHERYFLFSQLISISIIQKE